MSRPLLSKLSLRTIAISLTALLFGILVVKSFYFTRTYGGTDLRCRIVGSRLTNTNNSPYFYKWRPGDNDRYLDPNDHADRTVNGNVVTPAVLYIINPLAQLSYKNIRILWTILQFAAVLASLWLLSMSSRSNLPKYLSPAIVILIGLVCSDAWLYGIERGQIYILYVLFFSLIYWLYSRPWKSNQLLAGFITGIFVFFRPTALVFLFGFLIQRKFKFLAGAVAGIAVGGLLFVLPHLNHWEDYFKAMNEYSNYFIGKGTPVSSTPISIPGVVEGTTNITIYKDFTSGGMLAIDSYLSMIGLSIDNKQAMALFFVLVALLGLFFWKRRSETDSTDNIFLFGFLLYILAEIFAVAPRAGYNVIQWIFPLFIAWKYIYNQRLLMVLFVTAILFFHHFPFLFPLQHDMAELLFICIISLIVFPATLSRISRFNGAVLAGFKDS